MLGWLAVCGLFAVERPFDYQAGISRKTPGGKGRESRQESEDNSLKVHQSERLPEYHCFPLSWTLRVKG